MAETLRWIGVRDRVMLLDGHLTDLESLVRIVREVEPDEVYKPAAQSFLSWN